MFVWLGKTLQGVYKDELKYNASLEVRSNCSLELQTGDATQNILQLLIARKLTNDSVPKLITCILSSSRRTTSEFDCETPFIQFIELKIHFKYLKKKSYVFLLSSYYNTHVQACSIRN